MENYIRETVVKYVGKKVKSPTIRNPEEIVATINKIIVDPEKENFIALYLNSQHQIISFSVVTVGTLNCSLVHPREVFKPAIALGAAAVICAHNHPSGCLDPSAEDISITARLKAIGELVGIKLLDHVIVNADGKFNSIINTWK